MSRLENDYVTLPPLKAYQIADDEHVYDTLDEFASTNRHQSSVTTVDNTAKDCARASPTHDDNSAESTC